MTTASGQAAPHRPGLLDWGFAVSLALASVAVAGLPDVLSDLRSSAEAGAAAFVVGILGALGLAGCWVAAALRRGWIVPGLALFGAGVLFWFLQTFTSEPIGWRPAVGILGILAAGLTTTGWLAMRRYAPRAYAFLPLLLVGSLLVVLAPTYVLLIAGLVVASLLPIAGANLIPLTATGARRR
jgi:hypothetical protein